MPKVSSAPTIGALLGALALSTSLGIAESARSTLISFEFDPLASTTIEVKGDPSGRLAWRLDPPAFPGDRPGSLAAWYQSNLPPVRLGFPLSRPLDETRPFTLAAAFVIESRDFFADPNGYFQISWGAWNRRTTGSQRTGTPENFAADTFDLVEFDYFPSISPFFGGPFVSPALFGRANPASPVFDLFGGFANFSFGSAEAALPLDTPLVATIEHRPGDARLDVRVQRITSFGTLEAIPGAEATMPRSFLSLDAFTLDTLGLLLWRDGFGSDEPSLKARVRYHALVAIDGERPARLPFLLR